MTRLLLLLPLLLAACNAAPDQAYEVVAEEQAIADIEATRQDGAPPPMPAQAAAAQDPAPDAVERRLIRRATVRLRVDDYADARAEVATLAERFDAYIGGEQERRYPGRIENTLTLRVEAERFEALMEALLAIGVEVDFRNVEVEDVTRQYVDLEARLRTRRAVEARYVELLGRAASVEDILAVERQLAQVREEIEAAEGQLRYLRNQVALSTITLTLFEESPTGVVAGPTFWSRIGRAFETGWEGVLELAVAIVAVWPLWLLVALAIPVIRRMERRRKARRTARPAA